MNLSHIKIILLYTSHPGNIGAAARAMKTMGLSKLCLVQPKSFPSIDASARAANAEDVLDAAQVFETMSEAVADCHYVFGSGSEKRVLHKPLLNPREMVAMIEKDFTDKKIAIVFGRESHGMSNEEMQLCQAHIKIPANPEYCSLNLAAAVQVMCYELQVGGVDSVASPSHSNVVSREVYESFYDHLFSIMEKVGFYDRANPKKLESRMRRVFDDARLSDKDIDLLRGFLAKQTK